MSPLSPVVGYRFFYAPDENDDEGARRLGNFKEKLSIDNQKLMSGYKERSFGLYSSVFSTFKRLNHNPSEKKK